ncbi:2,3-bisphosphoglycerate-dependent phosphoglycerate mutase [Streptomyces panaciradicis]|uniref:2,3-bisphosphoglycerate-dependent phosphoglycerate mutase n=1 Tax=Streptomyces panaciradicis TaxID=1470261 RepID=UPI00201D1F3C|nr:2,3-bisphosphoglycerate-dependent phosphoglycerate mutase [Streptomyces panaciradicis]MCL6671942.1 2,3-bisphosphoglycerate-dependent phosphoglycerate mutase [Streptomyces panaciradicis]
MSGPGDPPQGTLILLRHGQSEANAAGVLGGWADFRLSPHGEAQAAGAARLIAGAGLLPDEVHTSLLHRSIRTAQIVTDRLDRSWTPVRRTWRLNERQYGALTGRSRRRMRQEAGAERYERRRRSLHAVPPPLSDDRPALLRADPRYAALPGESIPPVESFAALLARVTPYWSDVLAPSLGRGATLLVAAHGNSLRALVTLLDRLDEPAVRALDIPTAEPLVHHLGPGLRPLVPGGSYLAPDRARAATAAVAAEGHA